MSPLVSVLEAAGRHAASAAIVATALALLAWLVRRPARRLPPGLQAWIWWLVAGRLLLEIAGVPAVELAWLPRFAATAPTVSRGELALAPPAEERWTVLESLEGGGPPAAANSLLSIAAVEPSRPLSPWAVVGAAWLAGAGWALWRMGGELRAVTRVVRRARSVDDPSRLAELGRARRLAGTPRTVALAESAEVATPLVTLWPRPTILLPRAPHLDAVSLRLVLLHELVHLRRRDGWRAAVPAIARRLLFFHPFAAWVEREFALAIEATCDAEVVARADAPATTYGELLVSFTLGASRRPRLVAAWSMAGSSIHRRLEMLTLDSLRPRQWAVGAPLLVLALLAVIAPIRLVAQAEAPEAPAAERAGEAAEAAPFDDAWDVSMPAMPAPPAAPAVAAIAAVAPAPVSAPRPPRLAREPRPATPPVPALAPLPPAAPAVLLELRGADWLVLWERDAKLSIDAGRWAQRRAESLAEREGRSILLFGRDGRTWVVRDAAVIGAVRELFFERSEAAQEQARLAREAARIARDQSRANLEATRQAVSEAARAASSEASRVARLASREAERIAELQRELERTGGRELDAARERAASASRELAALEEELARVRAETDAEREKSLERVRETQQVEMERLAAQLEAIDERSATQRRELQERFELLEEELERTLEDALARGVADSLEP